MTPYDRFKSWVGLTKIDINLFPALTDEDIELWALTKNWPIIDAIFLSLGLRPFTKIENFLPSENGTSSCEELINRISLVNEAIEKGKLLTEVTTNATFSEFQAYDRTVDVKVFIIWARANFKEVNCDLLFERAMEAEHKSNSHSISGTNKGKKAKSVKEKIQERAELELEVGCKCNHSQLAVYLLHLKRNGGSLEFPVPINKKGKFSIKPECWLTHVRAATLMAFISKGIPHRNAPKDEPRGRVLCDLHRSWTPPSNTTQS